MSTADLQSEFHEISRQLGVLRFQQDQARKRETHLLTRLAELETSHAQARAVEEAIANATAEVHASVARKAEEQEARSRPFALRDTDERLAILASAETAALDPEPEPARNPLTRDEKKVRRDSVAQRASVRIKSMHDDPRAVRLTSEEIAGAEARAAQSTRDETDLQNLKRMVGADRGEDS